MPTKRFLLFFKNSSLRSLYLYIKYDGNVHSDEINKLQQIEKRIKYILIHSSPDEMNTEHAQNENGLILSYTNTQITSNKCCGIISPKKFNINISSFLESYKFNSCLNRKMSFDLEGNVKNCPSMPENYGNIKNARLEEIFLSRKFKSKWKISKNEIKICKDCEYRHICIDCRAYVEDPNDIYSKPLKCGYNPYTNEWTEWSTNPLKQLTAEKYNISVNVNLNKHTQ